MQFESVADPSTISGPGLVDGGWSCVARLWQVKAAGLDALVLKTGHVMPEAVLVVDELLDT